MDLDLVKIPPSSSALVAIRDGVRGGVGVEVTREEAGWYTPRNSMLLIHLGDFE